MKPSRNGEMADHQNVSKTLPAVRSMSRVPSACPVGKLTKDPLFPLLSVGLFACFNVAIRFVSATCAFSRRPARIRGRWDLLLSDSLVGSRTAFRSFKDTQGKEGSEEGMEGAASKGSFLLVGSGARRSQSQSRQDPDWGETFPCSVAIFRAHAIH
ncbi:hypothetical protein B0T19DRAFT_147404 [Cercophora scortea]|uniref:Transmembrane protein n=1 Tax=Cercophora scortea TaxID=314031 RepID=A0AAE0IZL1_9PEZI|nr:hypothetical protein B0T19DRAFT_147404 [Cercophora scortea]